MPPPTNVLTMTPKILLQVRPQVHEHLQRWIERARRIPNPEPRQQALASIAAKKFHCEGGGIYSLLADDRFGEAVRFIAGWEQRASCQSLSQRIDVRLPSTRSGS